ncbi:MAG: tetratricopeptide repeat protein [Bacteroidia bacterium]
MKEEESNANKNISLAVFAALAIAIITYFVFSPSLHNGFAWDDANYVTDNPLVVSNQVQVKKIFQTPVCANYHPLTILTLAWNYHLGQLNPEGYHLWNICLHVLNTILVFIFIFLLTKRNILMASIVSLFFGIHPMHVESVTWISERKDLLYVFFFFAGLIAYLFYHKSKNKVWYFVTFLLFVLSCLSKAMAVVFPLILLLIDYFLNVQPLLIKQTPVRKNKIVLEKIPFFLLSLGFGIAAFKIQHSTKAMENLQVFNAFQRIGFASYNSIMYLARLIYPFRLSALYPYPKADAIPIIFYLSPFILLSLITLIYRFLRKDKSVVFGFLFYFISIVLVLQFVSVGSSITPDRYSYLSSIGLFFIVAHLVNISWRQKLSKLTLFRYPLTGLILISAVAFGYQTSGRIKVWKNDETLWTDAISKYPERCFDGYYNRGTYYMNLKKDDNKALSDYNKLLELDPAYAHAYNNRGLIYYDRGQYDLAMADYNKALELDSRNAMAYNNQGRLYYQQGQIDLALADYNRAIELDSGNTGVYNNRAVIYYSRGQYDLAMADYNKVLEHKASETDSILALVYNNRGLLYCKQRKLDLALPDFNKALELSPNYAHAYNDRGRLYFFRGQFDSAMKDYNKALALDSGYAGAYTNRGMLHYKLKQYDLTMADFSKAIELNPSLPIYWLNRSKLENVLGKKAEAEADALKAQQLGMRVDNTYLK